MAGASASIVYNNATLDNWLMALAYGRGYRWCSIYCNCEASAVTVTRHSGGISAYVQRTDTGLYTLTFEEEFTLTPIIIPVCYEGTSYNYQAHVYDASTSGCKVMTLAFAGAVWGVNSGVDFAVHAVGR